MFQYHRRGIYKLRLDKVRNKEHEPKPSLRKKNHNKGKFWEKKWKRTANRTKNCFINCSKLRDGGKKYLQDRFRKKQRTYGTLSL